MKKNNTILMKAKLMLLLKTNQWARSASCVMSAVKLKGNQFFPKPKSVPLVGFGTFTRWKNDTIKESLQQAILAGYTYFDCSPFHENEELIGNSFTEFLESHSGYSREDFFLASKLFNNCHQKDQVEEACQRTLKALRVSNLDLYLIQSPVAWKYDYKRVEKDGNSEFIYEEISVPLEETWAAMESLVEKGLVKNIGVSNFKLEELEQLVKIAKIPVSVLQIETHPYNVEKELLQYCTKNRIHVTARTPLGSPNPSNAMMEDPVVLKLCKQHGVSAGQILLRWNVNRNVSVLPSTISQTRLERNQNIFEFEFTHDDQLLLDGLDCHTTFGKEPWKK